MNYQTLADYFMKVFNVAMVITPNIGFIAQILKFRRMKSSKGFSKLLSFTIVTSNILRIYFWMGKRFALPLLFQSIISVFMQITLLNECLKYSNLISNSNKAAKSEESKDFQEQSNLINQPIKILDLKNFWNWPYLVDYVYIIALQALILGFLSNLIGFDNAILVESYGIGAAVFEAIVGIPQIIQNCKNKSTENLSVFMIFTWMFGDIIKTIYYVKTGSPIQLICTGSFQMTTDTILILQIICFFKKTKSIIEYRSLNNKENPDFEMSVKHEENVKVADVATVTSSDTESNNGEDVTGIV